jgi:hypothetical protein
MSDKATLSVERQDNGTLRFEIEGTVIGSERGHFNMTEDDARHLLERLQDLLNAQSVPQTKQGV